ncbi:hypothetical protein C8R44DRAFT_726472 [Mycena epipterygia]|nr:hypothetical protein C8R44DRAFT_726472 [Mycena epipterygia]
MSNDTTAPAPVAPILCHNPSHAIVRDVEAREDARTLGRGLNGFSHNDYVPFLGALQTAFDDKHPGEKPVRVGPLYVRHSDGLGAWGCTEGSQSQPSSHGDSFRQPNWHDSTGEGSSALVLLGVDDHPPPEGKQGKTLGCFDTNVREDFSGQQKRVVLGEKYRYVEKIALKKTGRKNDPVWLNMPAEDFDNDKGRCVALTVTWLLEMVEHGFQLEHDKNGVLTSLRGFMKLAK